MLVRWKLWSLFVDATDVLVIVVDATDNLALLMDADVLL